MRFRVKSSLSRPRNRLRPLVTEGLSRLLTKPLRSYDQRVPNSLANLKEQLCKGDIILVEGEQRISQVIRYLTQSSWSHSALYIGDELERLRPELAAALLAEHGEEAHHLVVEAVAGKGVVCTPVAVYLPLNLRVCRPRNLRREDLDRIIRELIGQLGLSYDMHHLVALARYFFPVSLIPRRFRRAALRYGQRTGEVICSTMLARAFAHVGYPVLPRVTLDQSSPGTTSWLRRLMGRSGHGQRALYREQDPAVITPRDFDLSPYFDIVKFNYLAGDNFDYRRIEWATAELAEGIILAHPPEAIVVEVPASIAATAATPVPAPATAATAPPVGREAEPGRIRGWLRHRDGLAHA